MARDDYFEREAAFLEAARRGAESSLAVAEQGLDGLSGVDSVAAENLRVELEQLRALAVARLEMIGEDQRKLDVAAENRERAAPTRDAAPGQIDDPVKAQLADGLDRQSSAIEAAERDKQERVVEAEREKHDRLMESEQRKLEDTHKALAEIDELKKEQALQRHEMEQSMRSRALDEQRIAQALDLQAEVHARQRGELIDKIVVAEVERLMAEQDLAELRKGEEHRIPDLLDEIDTKEAERMVYENQLREADERAAREREAIERSRQF